MMQQFPYRFFGLLAWLVFAGNFAFAQGGSTANATMDARQIMVGDQAHLFLVVKHDPSTCTVQWATLPDSLPHLEIVEKGKIDTIKEGAYITYKQRLLVTGFDSGGYYFPSLQFTVLPKSGNPYLLTTDSLPLMVQTVAVDTNKNYKPIKGIMEVNSSWRDYIVYIVGAIILLGLLAFVLIYFARQKRLNAPIKTEIPKETLQEKALSLLDALEKEQLWQKGQVKEYYVHLTDIVRGYIEARFNTAALELTTDELLDKARYTKDLMPLLPQLEVILRTADLAKFAKAQPTPQEHVTALQLAKDIIHMTRPVIIETPSTPTA